MKKVTILIYALVFVVFSCEDQKTDESLDDKDYFPNANDLYWKYERYDSLTNSVDTLIVTIVGDTIISSDYYKIWRYNYSNNTETTYVQKRNDSIIIFSAYLNRIDQLYIIPFTIDNGWVNPEYHFDTSFVSDIQDLEINEIIYTDVVLIERNAFCCNDYLMEKIWIKPYVGLIKLERKHLILGPYKNETWKLIEYKIK